MKITFLTLLIALFGAVIKPAYAQNTNAGIFECQWGVLTSGCHINVATEQCADAPGINSPENGWCQQFVTQGACESPNAQNYCLANNTTCWIPSSLNVGTCTQILRNPNGSCPPGSYNLEAECVGSFQPSPTPGAGTPSVTPRATVNPTPPDSVPPTPSFDLCQNVPGNRHDPNSLKAQCIRCSGTIYPFDGSEPDPTGNVWTGLGCIHTSSEGFVRDFFTLALGLAGGLALLLMLYSSFIIATSTGDPKRQDQGKSIFTAAITGLLIIIFSVFMLNFIGVTVFTIPGF